MLYLTEGKTPQNVGIVDGVEVVNAQRMCGYCGKYLEDPWHKAHVEGRGVDDARNFRGDRFLGWDRLILLCDEDDEA